ncbi:MAG: quinate 5-dehydrogenase, partial [Firmicutes bacterium]|nr:quinate 5-dehydrogenase [Bacillota bacterium]
KDILVERIGTDGDIHKAIELIRKLDGQVDVFGMGGIDLYMAGVGRRYVFRDARTISVAAQKTPLVDGTILKSTLEYDAIKYAAEVEHLPLSGRNVFVVCVIDRIGMGRAFEKLGCKMLYGDLMFATGMNIPLHSLKSIYLLAPVLMPILTRLPFSWIYPTGQQQNANREEGKINPKLKFQKHYHGADIIAGDFHYIYQHLPPRMEGKIIVTNTVTSKEVEELGRRGVSILMTTTPEIEGRSFGVNVIEAILVALMEKPPDRITYQDFVQMLTRLDIKPRITRYD